MNEAPPLAFHACPPAGEWLNDPNGLLLDGDTYRLFAQHRADYPQFERTGWAWFESTDLLRWTYGATAIAPDTDDVWSGSLAAQGDGLYAWHTRHKEGQQDQLLRCSADGGRSWSAPIAQLGPARREWRDPFVFRFGDEWRMLLAAPCPWNGGDAVQSRLELYRSVDGRQGWQLLSEIGPWSPPGMMWEVPLLIPDTAGDGCWSLILSTVDRRDGNAWCSVRRWRGQFDGHGFIRHDDGDMDGEALDCGPDYYAAMVNLENGWPDATARTIMGWASNWQTGRRFDWPGFHGGPIGLPRQLTVRGSAPLPAIIARFVPADASVPRAGMGRIDLDTGAVRLRVDGPECALTVDIGVDGRLDVERRGVEWLNWQRSFPVAGTEPRQITLFVDGPLVEIHIAPDDRWISCALPTGDLPFSVSAQCEGKPVPVNWHCLA